MLGRVADLFSRGELKHSLEEQLETMRAAVEAEPEANFKQIDASEWAEALAHHYAVACPVLRLDALTRDPAKDIKVDVSWDRSRYFTDRGEALARNHPGHRVVIHVPFEGNAGVFQLRTNSSDFNAPPQGVIKDSELLVSLEWPHDQQFDIDAQAKERIDRIVTFLGWSKTQINEYNSGLVEQARQVIGARAARIEARDASLATSSIPVRSAGEAGKKTFISDVLVRRPAPPQPQTRADDLPPKLEPALEERRFEHILGIIRKQCLHIENHARTYTRMNEEERRNVILAALATHYDGFTAETDNQAGHTDILARHDERNVFICECKFWSGHVGFEQAIDQLFSYAGWRDTKLSIVMFVREKALTSLLKKAKTTLEANAQFVTWKEAASETELRATMHWPGDEERLADLNAFFVHTPRTPTRT